MPETNWQSPWRPRLGLDHVQSGSVTTTRAALARSAIVLTTAVMMASFYGGMALERMLHEALAACKNNPTLNAQRVRLRATHEQVSQALSGYRPTVRAFSEVGPRLQTRTSRV